MGKSSHFIGQPMYSQAIKLLDKSRILQISREKGGERYTKRFNGWVHLVVMLYAIIMRLLTTKKERLIRMEAPRQVSQTEKIIFPIVGLLLTAFIVPSGLPLLGMLFFGNLLNVSGVTGRLAEAAKGPLINCITILLGLTVGASTQASEFLTPSTLKILVVGITAFIIATALATTDYSDYTDC